MKDKIITSQYAGYPGRILYDADAIAVLEAAQFDLEYWKTSNKAVEVAPGRGSAALIELGSDQALLKRYYRGGIISRINKSLYVFNGYQRCRAFREYKLLDKMLGLGLPVPEPLGAYCEVISGVFSRQALISRLLPETETLAQGQLDGNVSESTWQRIGKTLAQFHQQGIYHADLNATNILLNPQGQVFLVDFDKSRQQTPQKNWQEANLKRLERSFKKIFNESDFPQSGWGILLDSYKDSN